MSSLLISGSDKVKEKKEQKVTTHKEE